MLDLIIISSLITLVALIIIYKTNAITKIRSKSYDFWQAQGVCSTPYQYRIFLSQLKDGSTILDIGCGNGNITNFRCVSRKFRKLQIDKIEKFKNLWYRYRSKVRRGHIIAVKFQISIKELQLENNYECKLQSMFEIKEVLNKYGNNVQSDYVLFLESFPVIPEEIMKSMILYSKRFLKKDGKIAFIHNLLVYKEQMQQLPAVIKNYTKQKIINRYLPLVWVDMGRPSLKNDFEHFIKTCDLDFEFQIIVSCDFTDVFKSHANNNPIVKFIDNHIIKKCLKPYPIRQFIYYCQPTGTKLIL